MKKRLNIFIIMLGILFTYSNIFNNCYFSQLPSKERYLMGTNYFQLKTSAATTVVSQWNRTWGDSQSDNGFGLALDSLNNIYITGTTNLEDSNDILIMKYDSSGVLQWYHTVGGVEDEFGWGVTVDTFDYIYFAGQTENEMVLMKYDNMGVQQWYRTWGATGRKVGRAVAVDSSNNAYLAGGPDGYWTGADNMILVKYDSSGVLQWSRIWGGSEWDTAWGVVVDSLDYIYITGTTESFGTGESSAVLVKYNNSGAQLWNRTWGGLEIDESFGVAVDSSDNLYIGGRTRSFGAGDEDMLLVKYDSSGVQQWNRTWGGIDFDMGTGGVAVDSFDNVYLAGYTRSFGAGSYDIILVKYDNTGEQQWNCTWGGFNTEVCWGVAVNSPDNLYIVGNTVHDVALVKYVPDIYNPIIYIKNPSRNAKFGDTAPNYDITILEPNLVSLWYTIDGGISNYTISQMSGSINQMVWNSSPYGRIRLEFYAVDFKGNYGHNEVIIWKLKSTIPGYNLFLLILTISAIVILRIKRKKKR